ncbi:MAG TPA: hypothetical protein VLJ18_04405 [Thermoanaerobaculia bacterium]|nr:hypothetical protein [Thermoanaerobaculia bacterium]
MSGIRYPEGKSADEILRESEDFFAGRGAVHTTLRSLVGRLAAESIPYAIVGGMALNLYGYRRETVDVDVLMTREGLERFRQLLVGGGYVLAFSGARKSFRDPETGVKIEVLTAGEFPGDGKPKPVVFPDPAKVAVDRGGYAVIALEKLIEMKIASGLSAPHRLHVDLGDVQRLIEELRLPIDLDARLDLSVRAEYRRLWGLAQHAGDGPQERG